MLLTLMTLRYMMRMIWSKFCLDVDSVTGGVGHSRPPNNTCHKKFGVSRSTTFTSRGGHFNSMHANAHSRVDTRALWIPSCSVAACSYVRRALWLVCLYQECWVFTAHARWHCMPLNSWQLLLLSVYATHTSTGP